MLRKRLAILLTAFLLVFSSIGLVSAAPAGMGGVILYDEMVDILHELEEQSDGKIDVFTLRELGIEEGRSEQGRDLYVAKVGNGDKKVWVQGRIHGGEPYGTNTTLSIIENLINEEDESYKLMKEELTMYFIPMYNPDGAEINQRGTTLIDPVTGEPRLDDRGRTITVDLNRDWAEGGFDAIESLGFYKFWSDIKPDFMLDIHHQGYKKFYDTNIPVTMSLGIPLAPGGPTLPNIKGGEYDKLTRQAMVHIYDALKPYKEYTVDQYITGNNVIDIHGGVSSAMMLGLNHEGLNPEEHSNPAVFLETSGQLIDGESEPLIHQNVVATHGFLSGLASGELYTANPNRWSEVPIHPISGYNTDYAGVVPMNPAQRAVPFVTSAADVKGLVEYYEKKGKFVNSGVAYSLNLHLTSVNHFEVNGQMEKVSKHMPGFKVLLDHQQGMISDVPYDTLNAYADYLIKKWQ